MSADELLVVDLYPSLLQPEGDHGNVVALTFRARQHGLRATSVVVHPGDEVPRAAAYFLGGSEDLDLPECARLLRSSGVLHAAVEQGAVVVGVGAGYPVLTRSFQDLEGRQHEGLGLLDVRVHHDALASGPVVTWPNPELSLPALSGYEFHRGRAERGAGVAPFAELQVGTGDSRSRLAPSQSATDGARSGRVIGTWLHGPLLPRNPELTDLLLNWCCPELALEPTFQMVRDDALARAVRATRIAEARPNP